MTFPLGFEEGKKNKVHRLKSLCGWKQSLKAWFVQFARALKCEGYHWGHSNGKEGKKKNLSKKKKEEEEGRKQFLLDMQTRSWDA